MPNASYYRKQAQVFTDVAAQFSSAMVADRYKKLAQSYLARAVQLEAETEAAPKASLDSAQR